MYLVFDIGGTNMRVGISADGKTILRSKTVLTPKDFNQGIQTLKQEALELSGGQKIEAIAGGLAGPLDLDKSMLVTSPHIEGWIQKPFKQELQKALNAPLHLENDAHLGGLGEVSFGAGVGKAIIAFITIGTGVGGVRIVDGKIDRNMLGFEPGHQIIVPDGKPCHCGGKGHLEAYIGGAYLDQNSPHIWDDVAKDLAIGLNNVTVFWSPEVIVLGGAVMQSIPLDAVRAYLKQLVTIFPTPPEITRAKLGDQAGLFGALSLLNSLLQIT